MSDSIPKRCTESSYIRRQQAAKSLRKCREQAGLTAVEAAARIGVSADIYGRWERGDGAIPMDRVADIVQVMNAWYAELVGQIDARVTS